MNESTNKIDRLIANFFSSFDNRDSRIPNFDHFQSYFVEGAVIGNRTSERVRIWSLTQFWKPRIELLSGGGLTEFHEWETDSKTSVVEGLAFRQSSYEKDGFLNGNPYKGTGVKFFQLALTVEGWRIAYMLWEDY